MRRLMSRLPIRWKLTLAFALGLAVVLTAVGVFLHAQLSANVDAASERGLPLRRCPLTPRIWIRTRPSPRFSPQPVEWWPPALMPASGY